MDVQAKTNLARHDMFESVSQIMDDDPATITPLFDRLLVKDVADAEFSAGGIVLTAAPSLGGLGKVGRIRVGEVIAAGKGDPYFQWREKGVLKTRPYPCSWCGGDGFLWGNHQLPIPPPPDPRRRAMCVKCDGRGFSHVDLIVKVGDRIAYDRRKEAEIYLGGERFTLLHEQQAVYAVIRKADERNSVVGNYKQLLNARSGEWLEPIYDRVLVEPYEPVQTGMIARPENAKPGQGQFREGIVRAVGQGFRHFDGKIHPLEVKPGDRVWFRAEGGAQRAEDIQLFGEGLLIMREKLIWAVLE